MIVPSDDVPFDVFWRRHRFACVISLRQQTTENADSFNNTTAQQNSTAQKNSRTAEEEEEGERGKNSREKREQQRSVTSYYVTTVPEGGATGVRLTCVRIFFVCVCICLFVCISGCLCFAIDVDDLFVFCFVLFFLTAKLDLLL